MEVTRYSWSAVRTLAEKQPSVYTSLVRSGLLLDGKLVLVEDVSNDHGKRRLVLGNGRVVGGYLGHRAHDGLPSECNAPLES